MTVKTIITEPNKLLRQVSKSVDHVGKDEQKLMDDMLETMYDSKWYWSCSNTNWIPKRIIVMDIVKMKKIKIHVFCKSNK